MGVISFETPNNALWFVVCRKQVENDILTAADRTTKMMVFTKHVLFVFDGFILF